MQSLYLLLLAFISLVDCGVIRSEVDEIQGSADFQSAAEKEELRQLIAKVDPIPAALAEAEKNEEERLHMTNADNIYQGDIILTPEQAASMSASSKRQATLQYKNWVGMPIPIIIHSSVDDNMREIVKAGIAFWNANTCVNFVENGSGPDTILVVGNVQGCRSTIGRAGGRQLLELENGGCNNMATVTHEMEHALGVEHEQSRADRDSYVRVNLDNIDPFHRPNFVVDEKTTSMKLSYDFGSNMHYPSNSFARNYSIPTLVAVGVYAEYQNSMRGHMPSFLDVLKVNKYYNCDKKCDGMLNPCQNGGYLDVKTCTTCVCPEGLGGANCTGNPDYKCLVELNATTQYKKQSISMGTYEAPARLHYDNCAYIIKAPEGRIIEVVVDGVWSSLTTGCSKGGIELKTKKDMQRRGFRFCTTPSATKSYWSETNRVPVLVWNNEGSVSADIRYRYA